MVSRRQGTKKGKLQGAQYVKVSMMLKTEQQFRNKLLRIKVRPFAKNVLVMAA